LTTLTAYVANCLIGGDEVTHGLDGSWVRDVVRFKCDRWEFRFRQRPDVAKGQTEPLKGTLCETTTVVVEDVEPDDLEKVLQTLDAICWLLSFASQSRVLSYGYEFPKGEPTAHFKSVVGMANYFRPPFHLQDTAAIKGFVQQSFPEYKRLNKKRKLAAVFDYLVQAECPTQPMEVQLLLMFVTLESLKDTFARTVGIPYMKGFYRKPTGKSGKLGASFTFEELLSRMLESVRMRRGLKQVIALRNEIIHSGLSRKSPAQQWRLYERVQDLVREYLFRLLGYHGEFFTYASRGMAQRRSNALLNRSSNGKPLAPG
jgi:hypothetical protein